MATENPHHRIGKGMIYASWLIVLALLTLYFNHWQKQRENPNANPITTRNGNVNEVILERNYQHHFVATGAINGKSVTFLVDTGATQVAVPKHLAAHLGLIAGAEAITTTANGEVITRETQIDELQLGSIQLKNVRASINPGMTDDEILLGMSALKNIEFTHRNGTLTLKQFD